MFEIQTDIDIPLAAPFAAVTLRLRLGGIPTGTAKHFSKYQFKRLPE